MEKIVLMSREQGNHTQLIALIEALFPECTVEVISKRSREFNITDAALQKEISSHGEEAVFWGD